MGITELTPEQQLSQILAICFAFTHDDITCLEALEGIKKTYAKDQ